MDKYLSREDLLRIVLKKQLPKGMEELDQLLDTNQLEKVFEMLQKYKDDPYMRYLNMGLKNPEDINYYNFDSLKAEELL